MLGRSRGRFALLVALFVFAAPAVAGAAIKTISGNPLTVHLDSRGQVQVLQFGQNSFSFYNPGSTTGSAGFFVGLPAAVGGSVNPAGSVIGPQPIAAGNSSSDLPYTEVSSAAVSGAGTAADPFSQVTKYQRADVVEVTQTTTYVQGARSFKQKFDVKNVSGTGLRFRASVGADLYLEGSDTGVGFFDLGPPRTVGGISQATGRAGGLREVTPWSKYQEAGFSSIWSLIGNASGAGFNNTIVASSVDNGVGVQWDNHYAAGSELANNATDSYEVIWNFGIAGLTVSPPSALLGKGSFHQVTFTGTDDNGALAPGKTLRYSITGANPSSGTRTTTGTGQAPVGWVGTNAGTDTVSAYLDLNGNNTREAQEPQAAANARFVDPETPLGAQGIPNPTGGFAIPGFTLSGLPLVQNGVTTLVVVVPSAGRLQVQQAPAGGATVSQKGKKKSKKKGKKKKSKPALIKKVTVNPKKAGPVKVKIRPSKAGKAILSKKGSFTAKVKITFRPKAGGKTQCFTRSIKLKDKKKASGKKTKGRKGKSKKG